MKSFLLKGSSVVLVTVLGSGLALRAAEEALKEAPPAPGARIQLKSEVFDAGDVVRGQEAKAIFVFQNTSDQPVRILNAKPGCGCTVASFDESVPPGGTGKVTAAVKTENFRGPIEKMVAVTTDDPVRTSITLHILANVVGSVLVLPRPGMAFPTGMDWDYSGKLLLRKDPTEKGELKISDVKTTAPWLVAKTRKVQTKEPAAEGLPEALPGDWILDVSVGEDAPKTQAGFNVSFKTGLPRETELTIPVSVVLQSPLRANPSPLTLPVSEPGKEVSGTVIAIVRPGLGKEALTASATPEPFTVKVEKDGTRRYKATVTWKETRDAAPRQGNVVFRIGGESISVPVRVLESKAAALRP